MGIIASVSYTPREFQAPSAKQLFFAMKHETICETAGCSRYTNTEPQEMKAAAFLILYRPAMVQVVKDQLVVLRNLLSYSKIDR